MNPWELIAPEAARVQAIQCINTLGRKTEVVSLREALGRVAAVDVVSNEDSPSFDRSTVDGYALLSAETQSASPAGPVNFAVVGEVRMGRAAMVQITTGQAVRIPTGGMLPEGADAVVMQEWTRFTGEGQLQVMRPVTVGENTILHGDDAPAGTVVLRAGNRIGVPDIGILAACGFDRVTVIKKPVVTVVSTGDEIVSPDTVPEPGQIRDVNSFTLCALAENAGCEVHLNQRVPDSQAGLLMVLITAVAESDVVLVSGGSSVGDRDFTTTAVQALPDVKILFHGIALKPGKPTLMAVVGDTVLFGLPGHTMAAATVFQEIVEPALYARQGIKNASSRFVIEAELGAPVRTDLEREEIIRVRLEQRSDKVVAWPLPAKSGLITTMSRAQGMIYAKAGQAPMQTGDSVAVHVVMDRVNGMWQGVIR